MRRNATRISILLLADLILPLLVLATQETTPLLIDGHEGEKGVIHVRDQEQSQTPSGQPFSLRSGVTIRLSPDWGPDLYDRTPTPSALDRYSPREIGFSEFLNLQNLKEHSLLKLASSNNPFQGETNVTLMRKCTNRPVRVEGCSIICLISFSHRRCTASRRRLRTMGAR